MAKWRLAGVAAAASLMMTGCGTAVEPLPAHPVAGLEIAQPTAGEASALAGFGERLYTELRGTAPNPVVSPLSVFAALGMAMSGADGATAQAFASVLGLDTDALEAAVAYLLATLPSETAGTKLTVADSAWLDDSLTPEQDWVDRLRTYFSAEVYATDLQKPATVGQVNGWVNAQTGGLIPEMLATIDDDAAALLVNALYLGARWQEEFDTGLTHQGTFTRADGSQTDAWYMAAPPATRRYIETADATGIVLPYQDGRLVFMAVRPATGSLTLKPGDLGRWLGAATYRDNVAVTMPKFHTEYGADLVDALAALGLGAAFSPATADFARLGHTAAGPLFISQVAHKVSLDVGEKGTEAAAATVVAMFASGALPTDEITVTFDRPYLYAVVDQVTGVPLFIGALDDPALAPPTVQ
ncbi:MAG: serpin family protein [Propionibacteriaceae bacterium]|jgi:serpin B|nr:serpin family protein [Propionibacteriaceae bacterium]